MFDIEKFLDLSDYATEIRKSRRKNNKDCKNTAEFFTPYSIVQKMCNKVPEETWRDPEKTFCEPAFGNGQFICYIIWKRLQHGIDWKTTLENLYGVELMQDNVEETKKRVHEMLGEICEDCDHEVAENIMKTHLVCSDFFDWNFEEWRPYTSDELKNIKKKK